MAVFFVRIDNSVFLLPTPAQALTLWSMRSAELGKFDLPELAVSVALISANGPYPYAV